MAKELKPSWTEEQQAQGERMCRQWEGFFAASPKDNAFPDDPVFGHAESAQLTQILSRHESHLLAYPNVVGVSEGIRTRMGKPTGEPCLTVYVERKVPRMELGEAEILPETIEGLPIDVVETGRVEPL